VSCALQYRCRTVAAFACGIRDRIAIPEGFVQTELELMLRRPEIMRSSVRANVGDPTRILRALAPSVRAPILMIHGRGDKLVPLAYGERLFALLTGAPSAHRAHRFIRIDGGHMVHFTQPDAVHPHLEHWLRQT
jgi:pimeloyl-ACP methyl ester carboxylesterase